MQNGFIQNFNGRLGDKYPKETLLEQLCDTRRLESGLQHHQTALEPWREPPSKIAVHVDAEHVQSSHAIPPTPRHQPMPELYPQQEEYTTFHCLTHEYLNPKIIGLNHIIIIIDDRIGPEAQSLSRSLPMF